MVIMINGTKHACASCIRGHRVKKCSHNDRPLIPLVKRGRQVSQCNHCRDLRKTNGSHVKCTCAIASTPNPINGCLCEVINSCSCVASHLQEVKDLDDTHSPSLSIASTPSSISETSPCHPVLQNQAPSSNNSYDNSPPPAIMTQPQQSSVVCNSSSTGSGTFIPPDLVDSELIHFLFNDLDKFISPTVAQQQETTLL